MNNAQLGQLGWRLASPFADAQTETAVQTLLTHETPSRLFGQVYPYLMEQKGIRLALHHLTQAGADLTQMNIPTGLIWRSYPMPLQPLWPVPEDAQWSLAQLAAMLDQHHRQLWQATINLRQQLAAERFVLLSGRAFEALFPDYEARISFDTDLWVAGLEEGVNALEILVNHLDFGLKHGVIHHLLTAPRVQTHVKKNQAGFNVSVGILGGGYHFYTEALNERAIEVNWQSHTFLAPSLEDSLLMLAVRLQRKFRIQMVNIGDAAVILRCGKPLDFGLVKHLTQKYHLAAPMGLLLAQTEARWPGTVPAPLQHLIQAAPTAQKLIIQKTMHHRSQGRHQRAEKWVFEVTEVQRTRPQTGWKRAAGAVLYRPLHGRISRRLNGLRRRLGQQNRRAPGLITQPLCAVAANSASYPARDCPGEAFQAGWTAQVPKDWIDASARMAALLPEQDHDCRQLWATP